MGFTTSTDTKLRAAKAPALSNAWRRDSQAWDSQRSISSERHHLAEEVAFIVHGAAHAFDRAPSGASLDRRSIGQGARRSVHVSHSARSAGQTAFGRRAAIYAPEAHVGLKRFLLVLSLGLSGAAATLILTHVAGQLARF
jgi:hypothetical protein